MLQTLYIENIAVIEKTSIDFNSGLNVLTGETGAGKSIIIDAINAIMGQRTSKDIIRTGEQSAFVSAQFENINDDVIAKLEELGFSDDEGVLILQRTLNSSGKSSCKINGRPATVSMLKELSRYLINIHGQHESYELFSPETHIDYIDSYGKSSELLADYREKYKEYKILKKKLNEANTDESERLKEIDLLSFQVQELSDAEIKLGEEESLEAERTSLMSFEKI
ncbi:MAG: AAA family ATPase, partial [Ruminococcus sp.]